jgi:polar amino acid transport system substrate-binding protein
MLSRFAVSARTLLTYCAAVAVSALLLAACGGDDDSGSSDSAGGGSKQSVTIGVDPTTMPFAGKKGGELIGMDADVARALAKQADLNAKITELTFDNAVPAVKSGRADISFVGGWYDTPERRAEMNVVSYYKSTLGFVIKAGNDKVGETAEERCGTTLATYASSPGYLKVLKDDNAKCEKAGKEKITVKTYAGLAPGVLAVRAGRIDGFLDGEPAVAYQAQLGEGLDYVSAKDQPEVIWGIGVRKQDTALAKKVGQAIDALRESGELSAIWKKYGLPESMNLDKITLNGKPT